MKKREKLAILDDYAGVCKIIFQCRQAQLCFEQNKSGEKSYDTGEGQNKLRFKINEDGGENFCLENNDLQAVFAALLKRAKALLENYEILICKAKMLDTSFLVFKSQLQSAMSENQKVTIDASISRAAKLLSDLDALENNYKISAAKIRT